MVCFLERTTHQELVGKPRFHGNSEHFTFWGQLSCFSPFAFEGQLDHKAASTLWDDRSGRAGHFNSGRHSTPPQPPSHMSTPYVVEQWDDLCNSHFATIIAPRRKIM